MIQQSIAERPLDPSPCGLAPYLIEILAHSLCAQFQADYAWACLRLPDEPGVVMAHAGKPPATFPLAPVRWDGAAFHLAASCREAVVAIGSLDYEGATLDYLIGRGGRPFSSLEGGRFEGLFARWQAALEQAGLEQREQALAFQARLAQRRAAHCRRLAAKLEAQEERQRTVYHDLINDLTPAVFAAEALQERASGLDELGHLVLIERQFTRMRGRLRQAIACSTHPAPEGCDAGRTVREAVDTWQAAFARRGLKLHADLPALPLRVAGEEPEIATIVNNLLSNAHKYTPPGGSVAIHLGASGRNACLVVKDSGPGVAPELRSRVFEPGVRGQAEIEGSGVGLAQVARIVRRLLGGISLESPPTGGSAFRVLLPRLANAGEGCAE
ncbi:MAG TPA: HAMP domain-containing sensor histidine kinase [Pantanalinema sp.]